ncbi:uncharacterized protein KNAG_0B01950 [Huiozyma naganishii CBS 8797]|uniref:SCP domain-containing protein n=1 Tax=Huiozyma naganishii (strain ATCC MYA-139 / BCRC 22969 / CBS 8797 / KCTC 17520 / NBRC 10181 / NCYC 3082 / Yp74L-3) TaxID=1071383 RepID=J7RUU6_HUIN7|nr:hypothetical protein KNAG_0B01950 [Kazachstania naganishii CBS 8797]CCK68637.1 hypothetical protein KNAG_0B01950 [Kazachstania naganishii CBS 8797]
MKLSNSVALTFASFLAATAKADTSPYALSPADQQAVVNEHNKLRARHVDTPPLSWSPAAATYAENYAAKFDCVMADMDHSNGEDYGENLAFGYSLTGAVDAWYNEISLYDFSKPGFSKSWGHFTQVVWKDTTSVGCALRVCPSGKYVVCEYDPPGNWSGEFGDNVMPLIAATTTSSTTSSTTTTTPSSTEKPATSTPAEKTTSTTEKPATSTPAEKASSTTEKPATSTPAEKASSTTEKPATSTPAEKASSTTEKTTASATTEKTSTTGATEKTSPTTEKTATSTPAEKTSATTAPTSVTRSHGYHNGTSELPATTGKGTTTKTTDVTSSGEQGLDAVYRTRTTHIHSVISDATTTYTTDYDTTIVFCISNCPSSTATATTTTGVTGPSGLVTSSATDSEDAHSGLVSTTTTAVTGPSGLVTSVATADVTSSGDQGLDAVYRTRTTHIHSVISDATTTYTTDYDTTIVFCISNCPSSTATATTTTGVTGPSGLLTSSATGSDDAIYKTKTTTFPHVVVNGTKTVTNQVATTITECIERCHYDDSTLTTFVTVVSNSITVTTVTSCPVPKPTANPSKGFGVPTYRVRTEHATKTALFTSFTTTCPESEKTTAPGKQTTVTGKQATTTTETTCPTCTKTGKATDKATSKTQEVSVEAKKEGATTVTTTTAAPGTTGGVQTTTFTTTTAKAPAATSEKSSEKIAATTNVPVVNQVSASKTEAAARASISTHYTGAASFMRPLNGFIVGLISLFFL